MSLLKKVNEVFTPRSRDVNERMYVHRTALERGLQRALDDGRHVILFGESGNGKTWLYRNYLKGRYRYCVANCAQAKELGSIAAVIEEALNDGRAPSGELTSYKSTTEKGVQLKVWEGRKVKEAEFAVPKESMFSRINRKLGKEILSAPVVIFENFESIFDHESLMAEFSSLVLLLDDPRYAELSIKFLVVGTPSGIIDYFSRVPNLESVSNRLIEAPKVGGLSESEVESVVKRGFVGELGVKLTGSDVVVISDHIYTITLGVAQRVHEYCAHLAYLIEDQRGVYSSSLLASADTQWLKEGLRQSYAVVSSF